MKLLYLPSSPFARKVLVAAHEAGLAERIEIASVETSPLNANPAVTAENPLGKVPVLLRDEGALYDSAVICQYLDSLHEGTKLAPAAGEPRWQDLRLETLADGISEAAIAIRREDSRPAELQWPDWKAAHAHKLMQAYDHLEREAEGALSGPVTIGQIAVATALFWTEFRAAGPAFREDRPNLTDWYETFCARPSMQATRPDRL